MAPEPGATPMARREGGLPLRGAQRASSGRMKTFTASEEKALREDLAQGRDPRVPDAGLVLESTGIPPKTEVSYVRDRVWSWRLSLQADGGSGPKKRWPGFAVRVIALPYPEGARSLYSLD